MREYGVNNGDAAKYFDIKNSFRSSVRNSLTPPRQTFP